MHKIFYIDLGLVVLTFTGTTYLFFYSSFSALFLMSVFLIYIVSKIVGYLILPYNKFDIFISSLTDESKVGLLSGFELFKTTLVFLLFMGFLFIHPIFWIFESILVVMMRIWGLMFIKNKNLL